MAKRNEHNSKGGKTYTNPKYDGRKSDKDAAYTRKQDNICKKTSNDVSYYNKYKEDFTVASNFPWYKIIGHAAPFARCISVGNDSLDGVENALPGMMVIDYVPGPGICDSINSAPNRAFAQIMADLYAKTTGSSLGFQQADLALMLTSLSSIASLIAEARRVLSSTDFWITKNEWYPRGIIHAMGYDWEDIVANKPQYVSILNSYIHMFNNIRTPKFLDVYSRQFALAHNIYVDEDSEFGQIYIYRPKGYYRYVDTQMKCQWVELDRTDMESGGNAPFTYLLECIREGLDRWYQSSDLYLINGALLRCYKDTPTVFIDDVSMDTLINPVVDKYMMYQLMNADIIPYDLVDISSLDITQNVVGNFLEWKPSGTVHESQQYAESLWKLGEFKLLRAFDASVSNEDNVEMTRLTVSAHANYQGTGFQMQIDSMGTEFVCGITVYALAEGAASLGISTEVYSFDTNVMPDGQNSQKAAIAAVSPFRYIPKLFIITGSNRVYPIGDLYNYTLVDSHTISVCNSMCALSLWKVDLH